MDLPKIEYTLHMRVFEVRLMSSDCLFRGDYGKKPRRVFSEHIEASTLFFHGPNYDEVARIPGDVRRALTLGRKGDLPRYQVGLQLRPQGDLNAETLHVLLASLYQKALPKTADFTVDLYATAEDAATSTRKLGLARLLIPHRPLITPDTSDFTPRTGFNFIFELLTAYSQPE